MATNGISPRSEELIKALRQRANEPDVHLNNRTRGLLTSAAVQIELLERRIVKLQDEKTHNNTLD